MISSICRKRLMFLLVSGGHICVFQRNTNMASLDKALQIWVKLFSEYLAYEISHKPDSWRSFLYTHLLSFSRFWTFCIEWFAILFLMAWQWKQSIVCTCSLEKARDLHSQFLLGLRGFFNTNGPFSKSQLISDYQKLSSSRPALVIGTFYYNMRRVKAHSTKRDNYM